MFILANKSNPRQVETTDALSILQALAIDKFRLHASTEQQRLNEDSDGEIDSSHSRGDGYSASSEGDEDKENRYQEQSRPIRCFTEILSMKHARGLRTITGVEVALNTSVSTADCDPGAQRFVSRRHRVAAESLLLPHRAPLS